MATMIHGIAASEHIDSSGEKLHIDGLDISSLDKDGVFNYEHEGGEEGQKNPSQIVGKITLAKKIYGPEDCEDTNQLMFWKRCLKPFVYVAGELFDEAGHQGAQEVAAFARYDDQNKDRHEKKIVNFSIEGAKLKKEGMNVFKAVARKVTVTIHPCNKACEAGLLKPEGEETEEFKAESFFKSENENFEVAIVEKNATVERLDKLIKSSKGEYVADLTKLRDQLALAMANQNLNHTLVKQAWGKSEGVISSLRKTLTAGNYNAKPSSLTGGAALQKENLGEEVELIIAKRNKTKPRRKVDKIDREEGEVEIVKMEKKEKSKKPFHGYNKNKHSKSGGLSDKGREKINREEGSNLKRPVTEKNPKGESKKRKKSFCARMKGNKGPTSKDGKLTPKGAALKRWNCNENSVNNLNKSIVDMANYVVASYPQLNDRQAVLVAKAVSNRQLRKAEASLGVLAGEVEQYLGKLKAC